jgi:hypothetical protein
VLLIASAAHVAAQKALLRIMIHLSWKTAERHCIHRDMSGQMTAAEGDQRKTITCSNNAPESDYS